MARLEDIVPPRELCELIPEDEFSDAAFAWHYTDVTGFVCRTSGCEQVSGKEWQLVPSNARRIIRTRERGELIFPAPTLQEIMAEIPFAQVSIFANGSFVIHPRFGEKRNVRCYAATAATAAMRLWLRQKGIDNEG